MDPRFVEFLHSLGWPAGEQHYLHWPGFNYSSLSKCSDDASPAFVLTTDSKCLLKHLSNLDNILLLLTTWTDQKLETMWTFSPPTTKMLRTVAREFFIGQMAFLNCSLWYQLVVFPLLHHLRRVSLRLLIGESECLLIFNTYLAPFHRASPQRQSIRKMQGIDDSELSKRRRTVKQTAPPNTSDPKVVIVWLESYEDHTTFPLRKPRF